MALRFASDADATTILPLDVLSASSNAFFNMARDLSSLVLPLESECSLRALDMESLSDFNAFLSESDIVTGMSSSSMPPQSASSSKDVLTASLDATVDSLNTMPREIGAPCPPLIPFDAAMASWVAPPVIMPDSVKATANAPTPVTDPIMVTIRRTFTSSLGLR